MVMTSTTQPQPSKRRKRQRLVKILLVVLVILVAIRIALPYVVLKFLNTRLANLSGYYGQVTDVDLSIYRGAYVVDSIYINKVDSATQAQTLIFDCPKIDISIEWSALFKGRIVSEFDFSSPTLMFTEDAAEPGEMEKDTNDFRKMLKTFSPFKVNRFEVFDGTIGYVDKTVTPVVDVQLERAHILARNLSNVVDTALLPANVKATADVYEGSLDFNMAIDALASDPTYDLDLEIQDANLVRLNDFFKAYAKVDINKGTFGMYLEIAAKDRKYIGYVKPFISDIDVKGPEDSGDNFFRKLWEGFVEAVSKILENPESDQVATKVPILGEYDEQTVGVWYAVFAVLRNGFIQAIYPALDYQVTIGTVQAVDPEEDKVGLFKRVFGKPGENKKKQRKNKRDN